MTKTLLATAVTALALLQPAQAVTPATRAGAATACKSALPVYDGNLRTRPLAMANEGTTSAFVTCANTSVNYPLYYGNKVVVVRFRNTGPAPVSVNCTLVTVPTYNYGYENVAYYSKTALIGAAGQFNSIVWIAAAGTVFPASVRTSCNLPPKVELTYMEWGDIV